MSLATLANNEILRTDRKNLDVAPDVGLRIDPFATKMNFTPVQRQELKEAVAPLATDDPIKSTPTTSSLDGLVRYIPTEAVTLYVAATAAITSLTSAFDWLSAWGLYWCFVALTPILFLLIYMGKRRSQNLSILPTSRKEWPWWKLIASTLAFMVWALAIPPLVTTDGGKIAAAFGAILVSTFLSLIGAVIEPSDP